MAKKILIVDDEAPIRDMLRGALEAVGFDCLDAADGLQAHGMIVDQQPDLVLLDWMMPGMTGVELLRRLRRDDLTKAIPIIMLTAKVEEANKISGLDAGADDYITKPFAPRELISRIKAVLRRSPAAEDEQVIDAQGLKLDPVGQRVFLNDKPADLGPTEFKLLKFFLTHQERAYTRAQLLDHVWGGNVYVEERTVDVHIRRLRKALMPVDGGLDYGQFIQTVRGTGYRFSTTLTNGDA